jgi:hypothetical protein
LVVSPLERVGFNHGRPPDENKKRVSLPSSKTSRLFLQHNLISVLARELIAGSWKHTTAES